MVAREALVQHNQDAASKHVVLLASALTTTTSSLSSLLTEVTDLKQQLTTERQESKKMKAEVAKGREMKSQFEFHLEELNDERSSAIYLCDGESWSSRSEVYQYRTKERTWLPLPDLPQPRGETATVLVNNELSVVGGSRGDIVHKTMYTYREAKWMTNTPLSIARSDFQCINVNEQLFAIGGHDGKTALSSCEQFDFKTNSWSPIQKMRRARCGHGAARIENAIYVFGGFRTQQKTILEPSSERYDIETRQWTILAAPPEPVGQPVCAVTTDFSTITVFCNDVDEVGFETRAPRCLTYAPAADQWTVTALPSIFLGKVITAAWQLRDRLYVLDDDAQMYATNDIEGEWLRLKCAPTEALHLRVALSADIHAQ